MFENLFGSTRQLTALIQAGREIRDESTEEAFGVKVWDFFRDSIRDKVKPLTNSELTRQALEMEVWRELCNLICTLPANNTYFSKEYKQVIGQLAPACFWKIKVKNFNLQEINFAKTTELGQPWLRNIRRWMRLYEQHDQSLYTKRLLGYVDDQDKDQIANRIVRAVIAHYQKTNKELFILVGEQVELNGLFRRKYLVEQLALYIYLFKNKEEARFLVEALEKCRRWVLKLLNELADPGDSDLEAIATDIIEGVQFDFVNKYQTQRDLRHPFYLDAELATYLNGFVKQSKAIKKILAEKSQQTVSNDGQGPNEKRFALYDPTDSDDFDEVLEEKKEILRLCLSPKSKLDSECCRLINLKYNNFYSHELPLNDLLDEFEMEYRPLYNFLVDCMILLKECVRRELERRKLIIHPR